MAENKDPEVAIHLPTTQSEAALAHTATDAEALAAAAANADAVDADKTDLRARANAYLALAILAQEAANTQATDAETRAQGYIKVANAALKEQTGTAATDAIARFHDAAARLDLAAQVRAVANKVTEEVTKAAAFADTAYSTPDSELPDLEEAVYRTRVAYLNAYVHAVHTAAAYATYRAHKAA